MQRKILPFKWFDDNIIKMNVIVWNNVDKFDEHEQLVKQKKILLFDSISLFDPINKDDIQVIINSWWICEDPHNRINTIVANMILLLWTYNDQEQYMYMMSIMKHIEEWIHTNFIDFFKGHSSSFISQNKKKFSSYYLRHIFWETLLYYKHNQHNDIVNYTLDDFQKIQIDIENFLQKEEIGSILYTLSDEIQKERDLIDQNDKKSMKELYQLQKNRKSWLKYNDMIEEWFKLHMKDFIAAIASAIKNKVFDMDLFIDWYLYLEWVWQPLRYLDKNKEDIQIEWFIDSIWSEFTDYSFLDNLVKKYNTYIRNDTTAWQNVYDPDWELQMKEYLKEIVSQKIEDSLYKKIFINNVLIGKYFDYECDTWETVSEIIWDIFDNDELLENLSYDQINYHAHKYQLELQKQDLKTHKELLEEYYGWQWVNYLYCLQSLVNGEIDYQTGINALYMALGRIYDVKDALEILSDDNWDED